MRRTKLFPYILLLSLLFFIWQIGYYFTVSDNASIVNIALKGELHIPLNIIWANLVFWGVQLFLAIFLAVFVWGIARLAGAFLHFSWEKTSKLGMWLFLFVAVWILLLNRIKYPHSIFSEGLLNQYISFLAAKILLGFFSIAILLNLVFALFQSIIWFVQSWLKRVVLALVIITTVVVWQQNSRAAKIKATTNKMPNIFIIGLDALRPDHVGYYNSSVKTTPNLDAFLQRATNFTYSITPLARTFPSWVSILTGQFPKHTHSRFNLTKPSELILKNTLPEILRAKGYHTVYSIDDQRFSNISSGFGFDQVIGPRVGVNDFIIGSINDFPLSNLLVNTKIGALLFPFNYGNRADYTLYDPDSFNRMVESRIKIIPNKPLFLSIHFCLTHWPYFWGTENNNPDYSNVVLYNKAVKRIDEQFGQFVNFLKNKGLLKNAIIVIISDHGEAFGLPGDRVIAKKNYLGSNKKIFNKLVALRLEKTNALNVSAGHGTDILSLSQYNHILAFGFVNQKIKNSHKNYSGLVSTVDIKPTILAALNLPAPNTDGISLLPYIRSEKTLPKPKFIFAETGFTPIALDSKVISLPNAVMQSINMFGINPLDDHIFTKPQAEKELIREKQRAVFYKNWELAFYPQKNAKNITVLVNLDTKKWTTNLKTNFAKKSPANKMLNQAKNYFGDEI